MSEQIIAKAPDKIPIHFELGNGIIDGATIRPMSFQAYSDYIAEAFGMTTPLDIDARLRRVRLARQVQYHMNGSVVAVSIEDVLKLPIPASRKILVGLSNLYGDKPRGKIIRDGDGIDKAITFELGTPIQIGADKEPICELEFLAKTYGDIEDVLIEYIPVLQAAKLIKAAARPLNSTLQRLTDLTFGQITVADGMVITNEILPRFLGSPDE